MKKILHAAGLRLFDCRAGFACQTRFRFGKRSNAVSYTHLDVYKRQSQMRYDAPAIPRLQIPAYNWWNEGLHGVARGGTATVFPQAIGLAAMFDEALIGSVADTCLLYTSRCV